jgi:predicted negative regulator of RcsB-dependent stress response
VSAYTEQEELDKFKEWMKSYGGSLAFGIILGIGLLIGYRYWNTERELKREMASALYDEYRQDLMNHGSKTKDLGEQMLAKYAGTPYAAMTALFMAQQAYEAGDKAVARKHIEWARNHTASDAVKLTATLRLARLMIETGDLSGAQALAETKDVTGFDAEFSELKGDIAMAQNKPDAARAAYQAALKQLPANSSYSTVLNMKLDNLGVEKKS